MTRMDIGLLPPYRYVRVLGAFYLRLTGIDTDVIKRYIEVAKRYIEVIKDMYDEASTTIRSSDPCRRDYSLTHVDEVIDELLTKDYSCDIALPRIKKRWTLESLGALEPRRSALEDDFDEEEDKEDDDQIMADVEASVHDKDYYRKRSPARDRERDGKCDSHRHYRFTVTMAMIGTMTEIMEEHMIGMERGTGTGIGIITTCEMTRTMGVTEAETGRGKRG